MAQWAREDVTLMPKEFVELHDIYEAVDVIVIESPVSDQHD